MELLEEKVSENKTQYDSKPSKENIARVLKELKEENIRLRLDITALKEVLKENGLEEYPSISDAEAICINEISRLKDLSLAGGLSFEDTKMLEILHKNLLLARGKEVKPNNKDKKHSTEELLSLVKGGKK